MNRNCVCSPLVLLAALLVALGLINDVVDVGEAGAIRRQLVVDFVAEPRKHTVFFTNLLLQLH